MASLSRRSLLVGVCEIVTIGVSEVPANAVKLLPDGRPSVKIKVSRGIATIG